jgi:hypothetical protein
MRVVLSTFVLIVTAAVVALADPYGPPHVVTDMAPFCASCHASTSFTQLPDLKVDAAAGEAVEEKHFKQIKSGAAYKDLSPSDRETLLAAVRWMDEQAAVVVRAPGIARRNSRIEIVVLAKGGAGPVVGLSLVDSGIRYQARSIGVAGFKVVGPPMVIGPDKRAQADWIDRRMKGSDLGLSTVMIFGIQGDAVARRVDQTQVTWTLRTPSEPGMYRLAAVFYYGTEKAHPLGTIMRNGRAEPRGGSQGGSGRIMFSDVLTIQIN